MALRNQIFVGTRSFGNGFVIDYHLSVGSVGFNRYRYSFAFYLNSKIFLSFNHHLYDFRRRCWRMERDHLHRN